MKITSRLALFLIGAWLGPWIAAARAQGATTVDDLRSPSTPAVTILGTSPTTIERPDTPRAVVFNLASSIADAGGIPHNYAMQVAPYWLASHPGLVFSSYVQPTVAQSMARSFAVSVATADLTSGTGKSAADLGSRLAVGLGAVIKPGRLDPAFDALAKSVQQDDLTLIDLLGQKDKEPLVSLRKERDRLRQELSTETDVQKLIKTYVTLSEAEAALARVTADLDAQIAKLQSAIVKNTKRLQDMNVSRYGGALAVAGAWSVQVPGNVIADSTSDRAGFWLTPSYKGKLRTGDKAAAGEEDPSSEHAITALGVFRYLRNRAEGTNSWDVGGRLVFEVSAAIAVSGEAVGRWHSGSSAQNSYRAVAVVEVKVADKTYLFASFGRDFTEQEQQRSLVSIVGLNFGFGQKPTVTFDR